jgi:hypothetical protein
MLKNRVTLSLSTLLILGLSINSVVAQNNPPVVKQNMEVQTSQQAAWLGVWIKNVPIALGKHLSPMLQKIKVYWSVRFMITRLHNRQDCRNMM